MTKEVSMMYAVADGSTDPLTPAFGLNPAIAVVIVIAIMVAVVWLAVKAYHYMNR